MNEQIVRRRRRISSDPTNVSVPPATEPSPVANKSLDPDEVFVEPEPTTSDSTSKLTAIDRIRTEILEDNYHSKLAEPQYWDETHNWSSDDDELTSDDYWHFLGMYE